MRFRTSSEWLLSLINWKELQCNSSEWGSNSSISLVRAKGSWLSSLCLTNFEPLGGRWEVRGER